MKAAKRTQAAAVRGSRDAEQTDMNPVHIDEDAPWIRGASLEMPPPRPGQDQRWIRVAVGGKDDQTNWARKQREGWKPRKASTVPESFPVPRIDQGKFDGYIGIEGMILCERPMSISTRRNNHFRDETARRTEAINADLQRINTQNRNPAFGPIQLASKSQVLKARPVKVAEDADA